MPRALVLEDFSPAAPPPLARETTEGLTETERLSAFEQGYQAGWDDAVTAADEDQERVTADLASRLRDLSFSFHEARAHVLNGVEEIVTSMIRTMMPRVAQDVLPALVQDHLGDLLQTAASGPVILRVSPVNRAAIEAAMPTDPGFPVVIEEASDYGPGQVAFIMGQCESALNLQECLDRMEAEIAAFFEENERQLAHAHG